jgi:hypothetical protein
MISAGICPRLRPALPTDEAHKPTSGALWLQHDGFRVIVRKELHSRSKPWRGSGRGPALSTARRWRVTSAGPRHGGDRRAGSLDPESWAGGKAPGSTEITQPLSCSFREPLWFLHVRSACC